MGDLRLVAGAAAFYRAPLETDVDIVVVPSGDDAEVTRRAEGLSRTLGVPRSAGGATDPDTIRLVVSAERLELQVGSGGEVTRVWVDLAAPLRRARGHVSRRQPLARAVGRKARTVVDATAGMGGDTALLACLGYEVTAIERNAILVAMLEDGLRRAAADPRGAALAARIRIVGGDARDLLPDLDPAPDAVYLDPMFPPKHKKSALARKNVRLVRRLVGDDLDAAELVRVARRVAPRVIVKRPIWPGAGEPMAPDPSASYGGKLVRYDVYGGAADS